VTRAETWTFVLRTSTRYRNNHQHDRGHLRKEEEEEEEEEEGGGGGGGGGGGVCLLKAEFCGM